jgi:hypothetical protein
MGFSLSFSFRRCTYFHLMKQPTGQPGRQHKVKIEMIQSLKKAFEAVASLSVIESAAGRYAEG